MSSSSSSSANKQLPHKEQSLFKQILRQYEHKQYKKGLKNADSILKKFPDHGETLAMRGLFLSHLDQKQEAYECVKRGIKCHLQSPICWHVYGLLYRMDKNYEEAMKCYRFALKFDKDNLQVLRDFSYLQVHLRDLEGYCDTEQRLLHLRPGQRAFWIGLAVGYHLRGNYADAVRVIDAYLDTETQEGSTVPPFAKRSIGEKFEHSEMVLYKIEILCDSGDWPKALDQLKRIRNEVVDRVIWLELKARILVKLEKLEEGRRVYFELMDYNADRREYISAYLDTFKFTSNDETLKELETLIQRYPRSNVLKHFKMKYSSGDAFRNLVADYLKSGLRKGVPSLFVSLKSMCTSQDRERVIIDLCKSFLENLNANGTFESSPSADQEKEVPTVYPWTQYLLAQIYSAQGNNTKSLAHINMAIEHTPTLVELYMMKARIYKRAGDPAKAAFFMNEARLLDLQDRFINTKSVKYYIRNNEFEKAEEIIALFLVRTGDTAEKLQDLVEMQCMWYALEFAAAYEKQGLFGLALKKYHQISKHFVEIDDDQFDFHTYCLRKMTIRSYLDMLRLEDTLHEHKYYLQAAEGAVRCYLKLHDNPQLVKDALSKQAALVKPASVLSDEEKKKKESKEKKHQQPPPQDSKDKEDKEAEKEREKDNDPQGTKVLEFKDALVEAQSFLRPLELLKSKWIHTHIYSFDIAVRGKKWLQAYKSLTTARSIDSDHAQVHRITVEFLSLLEDNKEVVEVVSDAIKDDSVFCGKSLADVIKMNKDFIAKSVEGKYLAGLRVAYELSAKLHPNSAITSAKELSSETVNILKSASADNESVTKASLLSEVAAVYDALCRLCPSDTNLLTLFKQECRSLFPLASIFFENKEGNGEIDLVNSIASLAISE